MCVGYPELCCSAACGPQGNNPLTPVPDASGKNVSLDAINAVLGELAAVTPGEFFHLGGDEVAQDCWNNTPAVQAWMAAQNPPITTTDGGACRRARLRGRSLAARPASGLAHPRPAPPRAPLQSTSTSSRPSTR